VIDGSVGTATRYRLDGPEIQSRCGEIFRNRPVWPGAHPTSCTMVIGSLSRGLSGRGIALTAYQLAPRLKKE